MFRDHNSARGAQGCGTAHGKHGHFRGEHFRRPKYNLPINIADNETSFEVYVYALGYAKENIKISVNDDLLYISGTRPVDENFKPEFIRQEFPVKTFERILQLNGQIDIGNISAKQIDEVLIITLPKTVQAQSETKEVKVE